MTQNSFFRNKVLNTAITLACLSTITAFAIDDVQTDLMGSREQQHRQGANVRHDKHIRTKGKLEHALRTKNPRQVTSSKLNVNQSSRIDRVEFIGNKSISSCKLRKTILSYSGRQLTQQDVAAIEDKIENSYEQAGFLLPMANVTVSGSALRINVIEGKVRKVNIVFEDEKRDKRALSNSNFMDLVHKIETTSPIRKRELERYILLMNKIHGYKVEYGVEVLSSPVGNAVADIDLSVRTEKATLSLTADNSGTKTLGKNHFNINTQVFNPISNDSFIANVGTSDKYKKYKMATAGYLKRLNAYGTSLSAFGSYMQDNPMIPGGSNKNKSTILKGRFDHYLVLNNDYSFKLEVAAEERKMSYFTGTVQTSNYNYQLGTIGGKIKIADMFDVDNWFYPYYYWTLKGVNYSKNSIQNRNFDTKFNYFAVDWYRTQPLPKGFDFVWHAAYQGTNKKLPSEHLYSIGSAKTGRGYKPSVVSADSGTHLGLELRKSIEFKGKISSVLEKLQLFGFYDITHFIDHNTTNNPNKHPDNTYFDKSNFESVGGGVRSFFAYGFYGEFAAGVPLAKHTMINGSKYTHKTRYDFFISKEFKW